MLVLSRKKGESIVIDDQIKLTIIAVEGETIKIGIDAPKHISIHREEIYLEIQEENKSASTSHFNVEELKNIKNP
jgi:carbon storage regulator